MTDKQIHAFILTFGYDIEREINKIGSLHPLIASRLRAEFAHGEEVWNEASSKQTDALQNHFNHLFAYLESLRELNEELDIYRIPPGF